MRTAGGTIPQRLVHILPTLGIGGAERGLMSVLEAMDRDRFESAVVALYKGGVLERVLNQLRIPYRIVGMKRWYDPYGLWKLRRTLKKSGATLVHAHMLDGMLAATVASTLTGARTVATIHSVHEWQNVHRLSTQAKLRLAVRILKCADAVIGVSDEVVRCLTAAGVRENQLQRLSCPVDTTVFVPADGSRRLHSELGLHPDAALVVAVGRLISLKRYDALLEAAAMIDLDSLNAWLVIVGDGPERTRLEAMSQGLGIADRVILLGSRSDVRQILNEASLFVIPSSTEGISVALLEAMSTGLPVVATATGGNLELVDGETGILVSPNSPESLATAIASLLRDPQRSLRLGKAARAFVMRNYDTRVVVTQLMALYSSLLDRC